MSKASSNWSKKDFIMERLSTESCPSLSFKEGIPTQRVLTDQPMGWEVQVINSRPNLTTSSIGEGHSPWQGLPTQIALAPSFLSVWRMLLFLMENIQLLVRW